MTAIETEPTAQATTDAATVTTGSTTDTPATPAIPPTVTTLPVSAVPETYSLKLPEGSTVDPAIVERTAAKARALGLTNEAGQTLLDAEVADAVAREKAIAEAEKTAAANAQTALLDAWAPGTGAEWKKQQDAWTKAAKADPDIGGEQFNQAVEASGKAVARFGGDELKALLNDTGYGRHPVVLKFLAKVGRAMSESTMATNGVPLGTGHKSLVNKLYGNTTPEPE